MTENQRLDAEIAALVARRELFASLTALVTKLSDLADLAAAAMARELARDAEREKAREGRTR